MAPVRVLVVIGPEKFVPGLTVRCGPRNFVLTAQVGEAWWWMKRGQGDYVQIRPTKSYVVQSYASLSREPVEGERAMRIDGYGEGTNDHQFIGSIYEVGIHTTADGRKRMAAFNGANLGSVLTSERDREIFAPLAPAEKEEKRMCPGCGVGEAMLHKPECPNLQRSYDEQIKRHLAAGPPARECASKCASKCASAWIARPGSVDPCPQCGPIIDAHVPPIDQGQYEDVNEAARKHDDLDRLYRRGLDDFLREHLL